MLKYPEEFRSSSEQRHPRQ